MKVAGFHAMLTGLATAQGDPVMTPSMVATDPLVVTSCLISLNGQVMALGVENHPFGQRRMTAVPTHHAVPRLREWTCLVAPSDSPKTVDLPASPSLAPFRVRSQEDLALVMTLWARI